MKNAIQNLLVGGTGIGAVEVVNQVTTITPNDVNNVVGIIAQIVIAIASLIGIFKRKKP